MLCSDTRQILDVVIDKGSRSILTILKEENKRKKEKGINYDNKTLGSR